MDKVLLVMSPCVSHAETLLRAQRGGSTPIHIVRPLCIDEIDILAELYEIPKKRLLLVLLRSALLVRSVVGGTVRLYKHHLTEEYLEHLSGGPTPSSLRAIPRVCLRSAAIRKYPIGFCGVFSMASGTGATATEAGTTLRRICTVSLSCNAVGSEATA
jgi:hypothetical protein